MKIHSILVHPNSRSLNADLFSTALKHFNTCCHTTTTLDVFQSSNKINEFLEKLYYTECPKDSTASTYLKNYNHDFNGRTDFINLEIQRLFDADLLFVQTPIWIWTLPAMFKSYCECIFFPGSTFSLEQPWDDDNFIIDPRMNGKKVLFSLTMGSCQSMTEQVVGSVDNLIHPIKSMFEFVGYEWITPHITWATTNPHVGINNDYVEKFQQFLNRTIT